VGLNRIGDAIIPMKSLILTVPLLNFIY